MVNLKRAIAMFLAICLGAAIGVAALYILRPATRTVVDPIELSDDEPDRGTKKSRPPDERAGEGQDRRGRPRGGHGGGDGGGAPAPPPALVPSGDDDDVGSEDDVGENDGGGDD
jgi:hypothetical protein